PERARLDQPFGPSAPRLGRQEHFLRPEASAVGLVLLVERLELLIALGQSLPLWSGLGGALPPTPQCWGENGPLPLPQSWEGAERPSPRPLAAGARCLNPWGRGHRRRGRRYNAGWILAPGEGGSGDGAVCAAADRFDRPGALRRLGCDLPAAAPGARRSGRHA